MAECISKEQFFKLVYKIKSEDGKGVKVEGGPISGKKDYRFDNYAVNNSIVLSLFTKGIEASKSALKKVKDIVNSDAYMKKLNGIAVLSTKFEDNPLLQGKDLTGVSLLARSLAFNHIISDIKTQRDLASKYALSPNEIKEILPVGAIIPPVSALGTYAAIGRDIAYTQGISLKAQAMEGLTYTQAQEAVETMYTEMGRQAVKDLEEIGLVSIKSNGKIINRGFKNRNKPKERYKGDTKVIPGEIIQINAEAFGIKETLDSKDLALLSKYLNKDSTIFDRGSINNTFGKLVNSVDTGKFIYRLKIPSNKQLPSTIEPETFSHNYDVATSEDTDGVIELLSKGALHYHSHLEEVFEYISSMAKGAEGVESFAKQMNKAGRAYVFGYKHESETTDVTRESERGQALSKTMPITDFMESWDDLKNQPLFYTFKMVRNARLNVQETVGNYQTDKHFSRFMMGIKPYTIDVKIGDKVTAHIAQSLADQGSFASTNDILFKGINEELDILLDEYEVIMNLPKDKKGKKLLVFMTNRLRKLGVDADTPWKNEIGIGGPWKAIDTLAGIVDLRNGIDKGEMTSSYLPKPDATASGGAIMAMQMAGKYLKNGFSLLSLLGLDNVYNKLNAQDPEAHPLLRDVYDIMEQAIKEDYEGSLNEDGTDSVKWLEANVFGRLREISKSPSMTVMYHQSGGSAQATIASDITDAVFAAMRIDKFTDTKTILKQIAETDKKLAKDLDGMTVSEMVEYDSRGVYKALYSFHHSVTADYLYNTLESKFITVHLKDNNEYVEGLWDMVESAYNKSSNKERITVVPASIYYDFVRNNDRKPNAEELVEMHKKGVPVMKLFETVDNPGENSMVIRKELPHMIAAFVNLIHMMDNAALIEAYRRTFEKDKRFNPAVMGGSMPVYDEVIAHPEFSEEFQRNYRETSRDINSVYDINEMLIEAYGQIEGHDVTKYETELKKAQEASGKKQKALADMNYDTESLFGFPNELDEIVKPKDIPPKKKKEKKKEVIEKSSKQKGIPKQAKEDRSVEPYEGEFGLGKKSKLSKDYDLTGKTLEDIVVDMSKLDKEIAEFFQDKDIASVLDLGKEWVYSPKLHKIIIDKEANNTADIIEGLKHEIAHYKSAGFIFKYWDTNKDISYLKKIITYLDKNLDSLEKKLSSEAFERVQYILDSNHSEKRKVYELVAVMGTEVSIASEITSVLANKSTQTGFKAAIQRIWKSISNMFKSDPKGIIEASERLIEEGGKSELVLKDVVSDIGLGKFGTKAKLSGKQKMNKAMGYHKKTEKTYYYQGDLVSDFLQATNQNVADLLWNKFGPAAEPLVMKWMKSQDKKLVANFPMYANTRNIIDDAWNSDFMSELKPYLNPGMIQDRKHMSEFLSISLGAMQTRNKIDNAETAKIDAMMKGMGKEVISNLNTIFATTPIFSLIQNDGILRTIAEGNMSIDDAITYLEESTHLEYIKIAQGLADLYVDGNAMNTDSYSLDIQSGNLTIKAEASISQLTALYSLKKVKGSQELIQDIFKHKKDLYDALSDASISLYNLSKVVYKSNADNPQYRGNMVSEYYEIPKEIKAISIQDLATGEYIEQNGWKILEKPTGNDYGIVYRDISDVSYQAGTGTNLSYANTDLLLPVEYRGHNQNTVTIKFGNVERQKLVLTQAQKEEMGVVQNPGQILKRSYSHIREVYETQAIRDEIVQNSMIEVVKSAKDEDTQALVDMIKDKNIDNPWFVKLQGKVLLSDMPKEIRQKYRIITEPVSNVKGFSTKITLVRKDIAPWLVGYKEAIPFEKTPELRKFFSIVKQLVKLLKIHWIIVNPAKITLDGISNTTLLVSLGVSPIDVVKGYKRNTSKFAAMASLRAEQIQLSIAHHANPTDDTELALKRIEDDIANHDLAGFMKAGMMQSISTDIILKDYDTITGLQRSVETVLNKLTMEKEGVPNGFGNMILNFSKFGINIEDVLGQMSRAMEKSGKTSKALTDSIREMSKKMEQIKTDKEMGKYLAEYIAAPNSMVTQIGSMMTLYPDAIAKSIYRDYLIEQTGKSEAELTAAQLQVINDKVNDAYLNYGINPPRLLKTTGDYLVTPFVTFWARIQRAIIMLGKNNPVTFFGAIIAGELLGLSPEHTPYHIVGSNILTRENLLNDPIGDIFSAETILPMNVLNFDVIA